MSEEVITLTGEVVITQGDNVITTNRFVNDLTTGNSNFGEAGTGERVRMHARQPAPAAAPGRSAR